MSTLSRKKCSLDGLNCRARNAEWEADTQDFVDRHDWIGDAKFGGSRVIPLRRPYSVLGAGRIALVGDSACRFLPPWQWHCDGHVGGLHLASVVEKVLAAHGDIGSDQALWDYSRDFHTAWGGILAFGDAFRRFSQSLSAHDMDELSVLADDLTSAAGWTYTIEANGGPCITSNAGTGALMMPRLGARLVNVLGRLPLCLASTTSYPTVLPSSLESPMAYELLMRSLVDTVSKGDA